MVSKNQSQVVGSLKAKAGGNNNINNATGLPVNLGCSVFCLFFCWWKKSKDVFFNKRNMVNLGGFSRFGGKLW